MRTDLDNVDKIGPLDNLDKSNQMTEQEKRYHHGVLADTIFGVASVPTFPS